MSLRRRLYFREALKRRKIMKKTVDLPKKSFLPGREGLGFRLNPKTRNFFILALLVIILLGSGYFFFFSKAMRVKQVVFYRDREKVLSPPFSFPATKVIGRHMFFLPLSEYRREIFQQYKNELKSLIIRRSIPGKLTVRYELYPPVANLIIAKDGVTRKFLLNEFGLVMEIDAESPDLPYITLSENVEFPKLRETPLPADYLKNITKAHKLFTEKFGMKVKAVLYKRIEREVHLKTEKGFWVWLDLTQEIERQLFKLKRSLPKLDIYQEPLEYIDLRISGRTGEKIIYKRR